MSTLDQAGIDDRLATLDGWRLDGSRIVKEYRFANYHETMAFVNASAWISHRINHHPDLEVGYNRCVVSYTSHDVGGLSDRDFDCAARIDALFKP
jgi:4a-hydroxytetrahydrobiopterin dehydratase